MDSNLSSISTWPRNQTPPRIIAHPNNSDSTNRVIFTATLANLKQYAKKNDSPKARELIQAIQNFLSVNDINEDGMKYQSNTIRQEPHFDSMILCDSEKTAETRRIESDEINISSVLHFPTALETHINEAYEPICVQAAPHIILTFLWILYLVVGAWIYQYYDPEISKLPYHTVLTLTFQICTTLGWGNLAPLDEASRLFTLPYALIGIPLTFACFSNYGRLLSKEFSIDWMFHSSSFQHKNATPENLRQMPLKRGFNLVVFHQLIGVVLFNSAFGDLGVINAWYFVFLSSARLGLGDILPNPRNLGETILMLLYFAFGNICMQAFLMSICFYIQRLHFVIIKLYLFKLYFCIKKKINC